MFEPTATVSFEPIQTFFGMSFYDHTTVQCYYLKSRERGCFSFMVIKLVIAELIPISRCWNPPTTVFSECTPFNANRIQSYSEHLLRYDTTVRFYYLKLTKRGYYEYHTLLMLHRASGLFDFVGPQQKARIPSTPCQEITPSRKHSLHFQTSYFAFTL
jgi:hypothetical protein